MVLTRAFHINNKVRQYLYQSSKAIVSADASIWQIGHTFCVIHFCVIHPIFKETHEVMQSVIQNFAWYKVSYLQWNKVSYYFFSDVEWHTIAEMLYLQEQEYQAPPVNLFLLLKNPNHIIQGFLGPPKSNLWVHEQTSALRYYPGLEFWEDYQTPLVFLYYFISFKVPQRGYPWTPLVPSSQNLWFINRAVLPGLTMPGGVYRSPMIISLFFSAIHQPSAGSHKVTLRHQNVQKLTSVCPEDLIDTPWPYVNQRKAHLVPSGSPLVVFSFRVVREAREAREW